VATRTDAPWRMSRAMLVRFIAPLAALTIVVGAGVVATTSANAAPTKTIEQVQAEIDALQQDASDAAEIWNEARTRQAAIQAKISSLRVRIAAAEAAYGKISRAVDDIARAAYSSGGIEPSLQALLADDPQNFLEQSAALDQVARSQGTALRRTQTARVRLAQLKLELAQEQVAAAAASADAAKAKHAVGQKLAAAQHILNSLKADERKRLNALTAARRAESQRAARVALQASRDLNRSKNGDNSSHSSGGGGGSNSGGSYGGGGSGSSRARAAVAYALSKVGHRYVAGATGPGSFDCSGLTMAAWRAAGVSLPHYSRSQFGATRHISRSELRPGDLLFYFGYGAHHVAIYIGGGLMVSASNPGAGVQIIGAWSPWYGERYSGATRVG